MTGDQQEPREAMPESFDELYSSLRSENATVEQLGDGFGNTTTLNAEKIIEKIEELRNDPKNRGMKSSLVASVLRFMDGDGLNEKIVHLFELEERET